MKYKTMSDSRASAELLPHGTSSLVGGARVVDTDEEKCAVLNRMVSTSRSTQAGISTRERHVRQELDGGFPKRFMGEETSELRCLHFLN